MKLNDSLNSRCLDTEDSPRSRLLGQPKPAWHALMILGTKGGMVEELKWDGDSTKLHKPNGETVCMNLIQTLNNVRSSPKC